MIVMTSLTWISNLSASEKSCRAHMSVAIVWNTVTKQVLVKCLHISFNYTLGDFLFPVPYRSTASQAARDCLPLTSTFSFHLPRVRTLWGRQTSVYLLVSEPNTVTWHYRRPADSPQASGVVRPPYLACVESGKEKKKNPMCTQHYLFIFINSH